jgi:hypothetical protein
MMRTYVRIMMGDGPHRPARELQAALSRGDLEMASAIARDLARAHGRPVDLCTALDLVALAVQREPQNYDAWACRWLARWLRETRDASIEQAAQLAAALADLPCEPSQSMATIRALAVSPVAVRDASE